MRTRACLAVLALAAAACGDPTEPRTPEDRLRGEWQLVLSCGGVITICTEGDEDDWLAYTEDDSLLGYSDGERVFAELARLGEEEPTPYGVHPSIEIWLDAEWRRVFVVLKLTADSLEITDYAIDGYGALYTRRLPRF